MMAEYFVVDWITLLVSAMFGFAISQIMGRTLFKPTSSSDGVPFVCGQVEGSEVGGQARFEQQRLSHAVIAKRASDFFGLMNLRRSLRFISPDPFPIAAVEDAIRTAGTAPSGAHGQPWHFVYITNPDVKRKIRDAVEAEEKVNWEKRMSEAWKDDLHAIMPTSMANWEKPYLTEAPCLIVCMKLKYLLDSEGKRSELRYPEESMGIACGMLLTALHNANLMTLTSTPMNSDKAIRSILDRPANEKVYLLMPVGFAGSNATVPFRKADLRKADTELMSSFA
jgi:iodotyrosine deiodinase